MRHSTAFLLFIFTGLLIHGVALPNPYYLDDVLLIRDNLWVHSTWPPLAWFGTFFGDSYETFPCFRPLLMLTFKLNAWLHFSEASFRLVNILLHATNAWLFYRIAYEICASPTRAYISIFSGLFFLSHPIQTLPINFLWKRSTLLEEFWILLGVFLHLYTRKRSKKLPKGVAFSEALILLLACLSKESGVMLFPLLLLFDLVFFRLQKEDVRHYAILAALSIGYVYFRFIYMVGWIGAHRTFLVTRHDLGTINYFYSALESLPDYFTQWLLPSPHIIDDPEGTFHFPWGSAAFGFFSLALSALSIIQFRKQKILPIAFAFVWLPLVISIAPFPQFFFTDQVRMYLSIAGFSLFLAWAIFSVEHPRWTSRIKIFFASLILTTYASFSFFQNVEYQYPLRIWYDVVGTYPNSDIGWSNLGANLHEAKNYGKAALAFINAVRISPNRYSYVVHLASNILLAGGSESEAKKLLTALPTRQISVPEVVDLGILFWSLGETERARQAFLECLARNPRYGPAYLSYGRFLMAQFEFENARKILLEAQKIMPRNREVLKTIEELQSKTRSSSQS